MSAAEHTELMPASWVGAVSDRGQRHASNEDAAQVVATSDPGQHAVLVVCDGVSSAPGSAHAASVAADLIADSLALPAEAHADPAHTDPNHQQAQLAEQYCHRLTEAVALANRAVAELAGDNQQAPSCTVAAAVVSETLVVGAWAGDSRIYWFGDDGRSELLTTDDSMAQLRIEWGVEREQAEHGPGAHTITRWLGRDAPTDAAHTVTMTVESAGWLVVCSDGLWNYASAAEELARVISDILANQPELRVPVDLARELVSWANRQGGADNITAAVARLGELPGAGD